jgi:hypothetical protein
MRSVETIGLHASCTITRSARSIASSPIATDSCLVSPPTTTACGTPGTSVASSRSVSASHPAGTITAYRVMPPHAFNARNDHASSGRPSTG